MKSVSELLENTLSKSPYWAEARYHKRTSQALSVQKGLVKQAKSNLTSGVGIRVLVDGAWGFSSTSDLSPHSLEKTLKLAIECAKSLSQLKKAQIKKLPPTKLAKGLFIIPGYELLQKMPLDQKLQAVLKAEEQTRKSSSLIQSATCVYNELFEDKVIVTTDGANATSSLARNEIKLGAIASKSGEMAESHESVGKTGSWDCLFSRSSLSEMSENAAKLAVDLLSAPKIPGGNAVLILSPAMVGLLSHEAIGHTVEADFVLSGSVAKDKLGTQVASPLVTLSDSGTVNGIKYSGGELLVDDEGVITQKTTIIKNGILNSYLHNRESAAIFGVEPTGNGRAWLYHDEPLIRMRNTYIEPGQQSLEEIIATTDEGYLVDCPLGGQADATGEFMFGAQKVTKIENGKLTKMYRGATISGQAFEVLSTVDAVSKEFLLDLGSGYCGKGQPAKVDAGGPFIRCRATIGGVQE
ncbi:MAG: TldD/PmbA family protein [Deltaproteobacteria bacterium]|nr:TldD/PmbA family protein [Deltaproteobacteria bacterium]